MIFLLFLFLVPQFASANETAPIAYETELSVDHALSVRTSKGGVNLDRVFLTPKVVLHPSSSLVLTATERAWVGTGPDHAEIKDLHLTWEQKKLQLRVGVQEIGWGETFGFYIADLVNPRDFTDPLQTDMGWVRLSVFAADARFFWGHLTLEAVLTPVPRNPIYTSQMPGSPYPADQLDDFKFNLRGQDSEYGFKAGYLFESGLDLSLIYFHHWNRTPVFVLRTFNGLNRLEPVRQQVDSLGLTGSASEGKFVFRLDSVANFNQPTADATGTKAVSGTDWQNILGTDLTLEDWLFGLQYHLESYSAALTHWLSLRAGTKLMRGKLEPELFAFKGLGNGDFWLQPKLSWNVTSAFTASLRADLIWAAGPGILQPLQNEDRLLSWLTYRW